uniref:CUB domain-containing protein n=1 Tax=Astyanax mexicanus TaxID=7994 RepID=A0A3B1JZZ8_ASTMX
MSVCECKESKYGHVQSPLYPEPYPVGLYMQWYLKVPLGYQIQLTFNHLDIEYFANCSKDSLTVLHDNEVWGKFCGQTSTDPHHPGKNPIMSPSNHVQLVFETDESRPQMHLGFFVFYEAVVSFCPFTNNCAQRVIIFILFYCSQLTSLVMLVETGYLKVDRIYTRMHHSVFQVSILLIFNT